MTMPYTERVCPLFNVWLTFGTGRLRPVIILYVILYSAKFLQVFNFANFQPFAKIFQGKFLTHGVQRVCVCSEFVKSKSLKIADS